MEIQTVLLVVLAAMAALTVVFFQYFYKNPKKGSLKVILAGLRFLALFSALLLLINPKFTKREYFLEKANLILLVDDSESMANNATDKNLIINQVNQIAHDEKLNERFEIQQYAFGPQIQQADSLNFEKKNTDIAKALSTVDEIFTNSTNTIVLFTDGNQTLGRDYGYLDLNENLSIYPIIVGDTTVYEDVSIGLINSNTYAFLRNKFPIEATIQYQGKGRVSTTASVFLDGELKHRERLIFNSNENSKTLNVLVEAKTVGVKSIKIEVQSLENERNTINNSKETAIEVIDEKTKVVIVSDMPHPDIGTLKKSIESNEQRSVTIVKPTSGIDQFEDADILILYQPNQKFRPVYDFITKSGTNTFTIAGTKANWGFLNRIQENFFKENFNQSEEILPVLNNAFSIFGLGDFDVIDFPPLINNLGSIQLKKNSEAILFQRIRGVNLDTPLFSIFAEGNQKHAVLFGENVWKWRLQSYRNHQNFENFDDFMAKLMVYLNSDSQRSRLELDFPLTFDNSSLAKIRASYFDESYNFNANANIKILIKGVDNEFSRESPMLLKGAFFEVDLSDLDAGSYAFTVTAQDENLKRSGVFKILDFNPEKQMVSSNYGKLQMMAENTDGAVYFPQNIDSLIDDLVVSNRYTPIQKSKQNIVSLIDFRIILGLMALALSLEWFLRKYNGLI